jgi:hypothetical protein
VVGGDEDTFSHESFLDEVPLHTGLQVDFVSSGSIHALGLRGNRQVEDLRILARQALSSHIAHPLGVANLVGLPKDLATERTEITEKNL